VPDAAGVKPLELTRYSIRAKATFADQVVTDGAHTTRGKAAVQAVLDDMHCFMSDRFGERRFIENLRFGQAHVIVSRIVSAN